MGERVESKVDIRALRKPPRHPRYDGLPICVRQPLDAREVIEDGFHEFDVVSHLRLLLRGPLEARAGRVCRGGLPLAGKF
jgi:hypothetical protein